MENLDKLLEKWNQEMQREFKADPKTVIRLGDQILLASRIISELQAQNAKLINIINLRSKEALETMEPWLAQYGIPYDCSWRDKIDALIISGDVFESENFVVNMINALNEAGLKYQLAPDGIIEFPNDDERIKGEQIIFGSRLKLE